MGTRGSRRRQDHATTARLRLFKYKHNMSIHSREYGSLGQSNGDAAYDPGSNAARSIADDGGQRSGGKDRNAEATFARRLPPTDTPARIRSLGFALQAK